MTSREAMLEIARRLEEELAGHPLDNHRLREIETIVRLLIPHLTRAVVGALQRDGETPDLHAARAALQAARDQLGWTARRPEADTTHYVQSRLLQTVRLACRGLEVLHVT
ncbi:MAG TPA: hypothetical protein VFB58_15510 [Chloroflexota bacterium]|nr:hypothetical protein [Chloroflexota bacterium]